MRSTTAALSPMWSQWRWLLTTSLSVQPRSASDAASQSTDGVAVSMASASRLASSPRTQTLVLDRAGDALQQLHRAQDTGHGDRGARRSWIGWRTGTTASFTWYGHACVEVGHGDGTVILFDPWFGNPRSPRAAESVRRLDLLLVTHGHGDHLGDALELAQRLGPTWPCIHELSLWRVRSAGRGTDAHRHEQGRHRRRRTACA